MNAHTGFASRIARWAFGGSDESSGQEVAPSRREQTRNGHSREVDRRRELFDDVGKFLFAHDLDLTPLNFGLALDYLTGNNAAVERAVRSVIGGRGVLTNALAEKIVADGSPHEMTAEGLGKMLNTVEESLNNISKLAGESRSSAADYGDALQEQVDSIGKGGASNEALVGTLISLTRSMVERSRQIEVKMQDSQKQTRALQQSLEAARRAAEHDHLTGLPNRRAFEARMKEEIAGAQAAEEPLCVAICDIDHFKHINDTHGHDTGDRVLKFVAQLLSKVSGEKCHVARHGGEEFVMLFRGKTLPEALAVVDGTRDDLASRNLVDRNSGERMAQISFSGGVADVFAYDEPGQALKAADHALYRAKEHGRNRIYMAEPSDG